MTRLGRLARFLLLVAPLSVVLAPTGRADETALMRLVERPDDQALPVNVTLNHTVIGEGIVAFQDKGRVLVPLNGMFTALELAVTADAEAGKAGGFFINEDRRFDLDLAVGKATFDGRSFELRAGSIERHRTDIYVDASLFAEWFSIRLHFSQEDLELLVASVELLPVQERLERERRRNGLRPGVAQDDYTLAETPSKWIDWPFVDSEIEFSSSRDGKALVQQGQYTSVITGMVAGLDLDMALNGSLPTQNNSSVRATLGLRDPRGGLLGIDATDFAIGDVSSPTLPLIANSVAGRGATVSTFQLHRLSDLERVTLRGELPVGWEVEIYRGGDLLDFQTASADGRYEFLNVATIPGLNAFKLVFYGPEGQRREEEHPVFVTASTVAAGETGFRLSTNQQNVDLIGTRLNSQQVPVTPFSRFDQLAHNLPPAPPNLNAGALRVAAEIEHGLTDTLSLNGAVSSQPIGTATNQYAEAGLRASWFGALTNIETATSSTGGIAYGAGIQSQTYGLSWLLSYHRYDHFVSEESLDLTLNEPLVANSNVQLSGSLPDFGIGRIPFATTANYRQGQDGATLLELSSRFSGFIERFTMGAETRADFQTRQQPLTTEILRLGTQFGKVGLRGEAIYNVTPNPSLEAARITTDFQIQPKLNLRLGLVHFTAPAETQLTAGTAVLFKNLALGVDTNISDNRNFSFLLKLSFGFGVEPRSGEPVFRGESFARSGAISPRAFIDRNNNGIYDEGDELLPNVRFRGDGVPYHDRTDGTGTTMITGLEPYQKTPISIDVESLEDPYWKPGDKKIAVLPRPGSVVQVDFPVYETGEIDGTVEMMREGQHVVLPGIRLQALDAKGKIIAQSLSGYDGYFFLQSVPLGRFTLRADPEQLAKLHLAPCAPQELQLSRDNPALSVGKITLTRSRDQQDFAHAGAADAGYQ